MSKEQEQNTKAITSEPWKESQKYLLGNDTTKGLMPEASRLYSENAWSPEQEALRKSRMGEVGAQQTGQQAAQVANTALTGGFDPQKAGYINQTNRDMGPLDPTMAHFQGLSGQVDMNAFVPTADMAARRMTTNFNQNVMPQISRNNTATGGVGSTRQGIAEGLAAQGLAQNVGDMQTKMYGDAYAKAQDRQAQTAELMSQIGLQGNQQAGQEAAQRLANRQTGLQTAGMADSMRGGQYSEQQNLMKQPQDNAWGNLERYQQAIYPTAGFGGKEQKSETQTRDWGRDALAAGYKGYQAGGPWGAALGAGLSFL